MVQRLGCILERALWVPVRSQSTPSNLCICTYKLTGILYKFCCILQRTYWVPNITQWTSKFWCIGNTSWNERAVLSRASINFKQAMKWRNWRKLPLLKWVLENRIILFLLLSQITRMFRTSEDAEKSKGLLQFYWATLFLDWISLKPDYTSLVY